MFGDIRKPHRIWCAAAELALYQVIAHGRSGPSVTSTNFSVHRVDLLQRTQPGNPVLRGGVSAVGELIGDEPVPELGVIGMDVDSRVDQPRIIPITL